MDGITLPLLVAGSVGLLVWVVLQFAAGALDSEKRKLQQRLGNETRIAGEGVVVPGQPQMLRRQFQATGLSAHLVKVPQLASVHKALVRTWPNLSLTAFLMIAIALASIAFIIVGALTDSGVLGGGAGLVMGVIPFFVLNGKQAKHQRTLAEQLPEALDFLSRVLRAGHSLSTGLSMMAEELPQPLSGEFRRAYDAHSLGQPMEDSLRDITARIESSDFGFFVTAVLIQRQTGGDLSEVLGNISDMIRGRIRLQQHVRAKTAEGRFTGYILVAFPIIMFFISYALNPKYAGVLIHDTTGLYLLGGAVFLVVLGLVAIRKITTVKV
jgi:tight adherence protein B